MEILKINNFLCIENAEIEIKKINLFIGEQAQGKSIITKLVYFCKKILDKSIFSQNVNSKDFEEIFPRYTWSKEDFDISYFNNDYRLFIFTQFGELKINIEGEHPLELPWYIPAGRSFFATIGNNIYTFILQKTPIDYFLLLFGQTYQHIKNTAFSRSIADFQKERVYFLVKQIIGGKSSYIEQQDWIENKRGKIRLADASSGQQEALPLTEILLYLLGSYPDAVYSTHVIIEEPEAHLFPIAQSQIVALIANTYNRKGSSRNFFSIATHSPYILTAFNNLIQAGNVAASKNYQNLEELYKVVPKEEIVDFNDVSAYLVNNGTVQSILNQELKLIDANMIDEVSNQFANTFEKLISMEEIND